MTTYRWQKSKTQPSHTEDWLMTYADMITLLLCFFAMIIIVSVPKKNTMPAVPVPPVTLQPAQTPEPVPPPVAQSLSQPPQAKPLDIFAGNLPFHPVEDIETPAEPAPPVAEEAPLVAAAVIETPAPQPVVAEAPAPQAPPAPDKPKGDRITTLDMNSAAFFDSGSASLSEAGKAILRPVAENLKSEHYDGYTITVEGHTDDTPIHTAQFPSNWELSTARASAVVHYFLDQGIPATRLRAAGYADTFPKAPNRDDTGNPIPANRAENRRVVITLEKIEKN